MELGIREWMIIVGVLLLIAVLLDGIRKMRAERASQIRVSFKMGGGVCDEDAYVDPVDREVSKPRVIEPRELSSPISKQAARPQAKARPHAKKTTDSRNPMRPLAEPLPDSDRIEPKIGESFDVETVDATVDSIETVERTPANDEVAPAQSERLGAADLAAEPLRSKRAPLRTEQKQRQPEAKKSANNVSANNVSANAAANNVKKLEPRQKASDEKFELADEFISICVLSRDEQGFNGADLMKVLLACDLRFGQREIFHRFEHQNGAGNVQFSMCNAVEPGSFNLNTIDTFQTPGVIFFLSLPGPDDPLKAFDYMVETANCIVRNLHGELKDDARSDMTAQTLAHLRQRVEDFERRQLTMMV